MTNQEKRLFAETYLGEVRWVSETSGYCECPGKAKHTTQDAEKDCMVHVDGVPTVYCFHQSCQDCRKEYSAPLRKLISGRAYSKKKWVKEKRRVQEVEQCAIDTKKRLLARTLPSEKLLLKTLNPLEAQAYFLGLFEAQEILWIGGVTHSNWYGQGHFKYCQAWQNLSIPPWWTHTCTGTFKPGHHNRRSKESIFGQKYKVIEFDTLDPDPRKNRLLNLAFFLYLIDVFKLVRRMLVDTGGKSLHLWVDNDPKIFDSEFEDFLTALGADYRLLEPAQPVRRPGAIRRETGKQQAVIML